jgi:hypothetical protein
MLVDIDRSVDRFLRDRLVRDGPPGIERCKGPLHRAAGFRDDSDAGGKRKGSYEARHQPRRSVVKSCQTSAKPAAGAQAMPRRAPDG